MTSQSAIQPFFGLNNRCPTRYLVGFIGRDQLAAEQGQRDAMPHILCAGRYIDKLSRVEGELKFVGRLVPFDIELIPNSIVKSVY